MASVPTADYVLSSTGIWMTVVEATQYRPQIVRHYMITNTDTSAATVSMRIYNGSNVLQAEILHNYELQVGVPLNCVNAFIVLDPQYVLKVKVDNDLTYIAAWGGYDE